MEAESLCGNYFFAKKSGLPLFAGKKTIKKTRLTGIGGCVLGVLGVRAKSHPETPEVASKRKKLAAALSMAVRCP